MTTKTAAPVALLILEGQANRFRSFLSHLPDDTRFVRVMSKEEARQILDSGRQIDYIGVGTVDGGNGIFERELGVAKMAGLEMPSKLPQSVSNQRVWPT